MELRSWLKSDPFALITDHTRGDLSDRQIVGRDEGAVFAGQTDKAPTGPMKVKVATCTACDNVGYEGVISCTHNVSAAKDWGRCLLRPCSHSK